jgi:hypothetical protein
MLPPHTQIMKVYLERVFSTGFLHKACCFLLRRKQQYGRIKIIYIFGKRTIVSAENCQWEQLSAKIIVSVDDCQKQGMK